MAAIISEKFRIFNAKQFLESLTEGATDTSADRSRMYFFVGRPQAWNSFLEIYSIDGGSFSAGQSVWSGGTGYADATFKGTIEQVLDNSLILSSIGPVPTAAPTLGSTLNGWDGSNNTGVTAQTGVYRYSRNDVPPVPLDNQVEKYDIYDDIIASKRVTSSYARSVIRRYNYDQITNPRFDMWKPDYSDTPAGGGQIGKSTGTGATSISNAKFYVMNQRYEVFKCIYNGESAANPSGVDVQHEPFKAPSAGLGTYDAATRNYTSPDNSYIWKYLFTIPTDDVLAFLSTDFMPIVESTEPTRVETEAAAVDGSVDVAVIKNVGADLPNAGTYYAPVLGDGTGGIVKIVTTGGTIDTAELVQVGSGYTYATCPIITGIPLGTAGSTEAIGLFSDSAFTTSETVTASDTPSLEIILSPQGGHGSDLETELNAKRVMTNIRLTFIESAGDFPVDNDFRRIGIIKDPLIPGGGDFATDDTLNGLYAVKINLTTADYIPDETITQTVAGGTAMGQVVSWTRDVPGTAPTPSTPSGGVLKYIQSPQVHQDSGVVRSFESSANAIAGDQSASPGTIDTALANGTLLLGCTFNSGLASPELQNNSGDLIYIENRRLITRAPDQIEDIKLVIEF